MFIVWDKTVAEKLKNNYTVLELETFVKENKSVTAYCIVDQVSIAELPTLENSKNLHGKFIEEYKKGNASFCNDLYPFLKGKFNGELDSFYDSIIHKLSVN